MTLRELQERKSKVATQITEVLELAQNEERALWADDADGHINERNVVDEGMAEIETLNTRIGEFEMHRSLAQEFAEDRTETPASPFISQTNTTAEEGADTTFKQERAALKNELRGYLSGTTSRAAYLERCANINREAMGGLTDEVRAATYPLYTGSDISGGFITAPQEFVKELIRDHDDMLAMRELISVYQVKQAQSLGFPRVTQSYAGAVHGTEIGTIPELTTPAQFGKREWLPRPITGWIGLSNDMLTAGVIPVEEFVRSELARVFDEQVETDIMTGDGTNESLGIFTASALGISTGRDVSTGNTTTTISFDGLKNAKNSVDRRDWPNASWLFHVDAVDQIDMLKYGDGRYIWSESVSDGNNMPRLLGFPVHLSDKCPNTFTTGLYVGAFGNFKEYLLAEVTTVGIKRLDELLALNNETLYLLRQSVDGCVKRESAFARVTLA